MTSENTDNWEISSWSI